MEPNLPPRYLVSGVSINVKTPEKVQAESPQFLEKIHHKGHRRKSLGWFSNARSATDWLKAPFSERHFENHFKKTIQSVELTLYEIIICPRLILRME